MRRFAVWIPFLMLLTAIGCSDGSPTENTPATARVVLQATRTATDAIGDTIRVRAEAQTAAGAAISGVPVTWSVDNASVATISNDGLLTTRGNGTVTVTARGGGATGTLAVTVAQVATSLVLSRDSLVLDRWGDTATIAVTAQDRLGNAVSAAALQWVSADTAVARVAPNGGQILSGRDGTAMVTVSAGGAGPSRQVRVRVAAQRNAQCVLPAAAVARGAPAGAVSWQASVLPDGRIPPFDATKYEGVHGVPVAIDLNGDSRLDVFIPYYLRRTPTQPGSDANAIVFRNTGTGLVAAPEYWGNQAASWVNPRVSVLLDADGDGRRDLLLLDTGYDPDVGCGSATFPNLCTGARNTLLTVSGNGLTNATTRLTANASNAFSHAGDAADIDCDGDPDFFEGTWGNSAAPEPSHLQMNNNGSFAVDDTRLPSDLARNSTVGFAFCDIDRDGDPDGIVSIFARRVRVLINNGFGRFRLLPESAIPQAAGGDGTTEYAEVGCGDFDGDGWNDLILGRHANLVQNEGITLLINNRNATFRDGSIGARTTLSAAGQGAWPSEIDIADINRDGWPDLVITSPAARGRILYATGGGSFSEYVFPDDSQLFWAGPGTKFAIADFNSDQRPDLFVFRGQYEHVILFNR